MRPLRNEVVSCSVMSGWPARRPNSSSALISSHCSVFSPRPRPHADQMPPASQPAAFERDVEVAFPKSLVRIGGGAPSPPIPHDHRTAAILALGNVAFEIEVLHRVIFGANGEPLLADDHAGPSRHRPALERAVELEPQVVVNAARIVLLHHELPAAPLPSLRLRLGGAREIALLPVVLERVATRSRLRACLANRHNGSVDPSAIVVGCDLARPNILRPHVTLGLAALHANLQRTTRTGRAASRSISAPISRATPRARHCPTQDSVASRRPRPRAVPCAGEADRG